MNDEVANFARNVSIPLGQAYGWKPEVLWTQVLSDALVAASFFIVPFILLYFFWNRRHELKLQSAFTLFIFFLVAMGTSHALNILVQWFAFYEYQAAVKFVTAVASIATLFFLWPFVPEIFAISSNESLKEQNRSLLDIREKYRLLLSQSHIGIYEWRRMKSRQATMLWSTRLFEFLGFSPHAFEPAVEFFLTLVHPDERPKFIRLFRSQSSSFSREDLQFDARLRVKSEYRWFRIQNILSDQNSSDSFMLGIVEDIHEQRQSEERNKHLNENLEKEIKRRTLQFEQASNAKTRFLANASHEMRNPLGLLLGFSELLSESANLDQDSREYIRLIRKNGEILSRIINDLLDLSKIEAGKIQFQYSLISIQQLFDDLIKNFTEQALAKGIRLHVSNHCPPQEMVVTDEVRLRQIIYNLVSSAIQLTEHGEIRLVLSKKDQVYHMDLIDTGSSIRVEKRNSVLSDFSKIRLSEDVQAGTSLGLHLAFNLAQALGGSLELISSPASRGSHFRLTFFSDKQRLQKQSERLKDVQNSSKLSHFEIFVLDDNSDNIRLAEIFLKKLGCRVRGFVSPRTLLAEMASAEPDLILLDINMPEMNGFEVFDRLRQSGYKKPIWALTAYGLNEDIQAILSHGFDDYIRKPIGIESMKRKLILELRENRDD
jgi:signal transduction histidine kinase/ActR/RegA family two-component response regulator